MAENRFRSGVLNATGQNILDVALNSLYGITIINTGDRTTGLPDKYSYFMGLVVNRTPDSIWVVIWGRYTGTRFAVNHYLHHVALNGEAVKSNLGIRKLGK
ncbi:MAG: hypothetical protein K2O06_02775 [Acetatifactor sp.]|nr:hypothetical protein [Acetatifactor sp.]